MVPTTAAKVATTPTATFAATPSSLSKSHLTTGDVAQNFRLIKETETLEAVAESIAGRQRLGAGWATANTGHLASPG